MANPTYSCYIAFTNNPFDTAITWVDVSSDLMKFNIRRGRQWELNRMETGTNVIRLKNLHSDYWPTNTTGSYYPNIQPWKRIKLSATWNAITYDLFTGYIESWQPTFILKPIKAPVMDLACSDGIKHFSMLLLNDVVGYSQETGGVRIGNILTTMGWAVSTRNIDTGVTTLQVTGALANANAMVQVLKVQDTELGILFASASGDMVFQDRQHRFFPPFDTSQATFGDTGTDNKYTGVELSYEDLRIYNDIRVTPLGGAEQVATSTTSIDSYGKRSLERTGLLMTSNADALAQSQYLLARYQSPVMRCKAIEIKANSDPTNLYPKILGYEISTRITAKLNQASLNKDYHIEGIYHDWDVTNPEGLKTIWWLTDATQSNAWIWDTSLWDSADVWIY